MSEKYRPSLAQARAQLDRPLDPELEFEHHSKMLVVAEGEGRIPAMTSQERTFISLYRMGLTWQQAARGAGMSIQEAMSFKDDPRYQAADDLVNTMRESHLVVTKDLLTFQYYEAMSTAETAGEKIRGLDSLAKLHEIGGFARPLPASQQERGLADGTAEGLSTEAKRKKLNNMPTSVLIKEAGIDEGFFDPTPIERD